NTFSFSATGNLTGGTGADTFKLDNSGATASLTGTIDGGLGANTLDYSAFSGAVAVGLATMSSGSAQGVTGGFSNIQSLVGNDATTSATTTLTGPNSGATFTLSGANSGCAGKSVDRGGGATARVRGDES